MYNFFIAEWELGMLLYELKQPSDAVSCAVLQRAAREEERGRAPRLIGGPFASHFTLSEGIPGSLTFSALPAPPRASRFLPAFLTSQRNVVPLTRSQWSASTAFRPLLLPFAPFN
jgi:hypothetical protein